MISRLFCLSLLLAAPFPALAAPGDVAAPEKIEGTANTDPVPVRDPDQALLSTIKYPDNMKAQVFAREPDVLNATAIAFDEQNRLYVSETHRFDRGIEDNRRNWYWLRDEVGLTSTADRLAMFEKYADKKEEGYYTKHAEKIRVLVDADGDGKAEKSVLYANGFNDPLDGTAAGIMAANGKVYFACIPHVWMLEDTDGDLKADTRKSLQEGYGISVSLSGHDLNGFAFGPDGRIYFTIGDRGYRLETPDGRLLYDQYGGAIFRMEPDGRGLEVVHTGLRNPKEIAFDQFGAAFSVDNNADMGDLARVVYMVEGAHSGWTRGHQNLRNFRHAVDAGPRNPTPWMAEGGWEMEAENRPDYYLQPVGHLSTGPSGLAYNPGTGLAEQWNHNFFVCDYRGAKSAVIAFRMEPSGAAYTVAREEPFIEGLLNTDVEFGYDGKVYVSDFTGGWKTYDVGTIYVFEDPVESAKPVVAEVRSLFAGGFEQRPPAELAGLLRHQDLRVRQRAQFALAREVGNRDHLLGAAATDNPLTTRLHGVWGLGQLARVHRDPESARLLAALTTDSEWRVRGQAAQALGEAAPLAHRESIADLLDDDHANTRMLAAIALGKAGQAEDIPALIGVLEENADRDPYLRHGAVQGLRLIAEATGAVDPLLAFATHDSPAVRRGLVLTFRHLRHPAIASFLDDQDASIAIEAVQAINDAYIEGARPALAGATDLLGTSTSMIDNRIINAIYRLGGPENIERILEIAANPDLPATARMEALFVLRRWENPAPGDPTTGKIRPIEGDRSLESHRAEITTTLRDLLKSASGDLLAEVISTSEQFEVEIKPATLLTHFTNPKNATNIRLAALQTLQKTKSPLLRPALDRTIDDPDAEIRGRSLEALAALDPDAAVVQSAAMLAAPETIDRQRALAVLAKLDHPGAAKLILTNLKEIEDRPLAIHLDILEAGEKRTEPEIAEALGAYQAGIDPSDPMTVFGLAVEGGDIDRGRRVFYNHGAAQCTRCHIGQKGRKGGVAGPDLGNVGSLHDRTYLLESLIKPGAHIAPGYGTVSLTLKDGTVVAGVLAKEGDEEVVLKDLVSNEPKTYPRSEITSISTPVSTMPAMFGILTRAEARDLVAYLASLKGE